MQVRRDGVPVEVERKAFLFLKYLIERHDRVVTKKELLERLWGGVFVGESVLTRCASVARKALCDRPRQPRFVKTVYGEGYRFVGEVRGPIVASGEAHQGATADARCRRCEAAADEAQGVFVARTRELAGAAAAARAAAAGRGCLILVSGEPGIGKTRLCEEMAARCTVPAMRVYWGKASEVKGAPAYWAWTQILRPIAELAESKGIALPHGLGAFLPGSAFGDEKDGSCQSAQGRFLLFDRVGQLLLAVSRRVPLLLVLDDLHSADVGSLRLLEFLAEQVLGRARILVIGTYRDAELSEQRARHEIVARVARACTPVVHRLAGLSLADVCRWLRVCLGPWASDELAQQLFAQTSGNPFFLTRLVPFVEGGSGQAPGLDVLPTTVKDAVCRQVCSLPESTLDLLCIGAVIGREFDLTVACRVAGLELSRAASWLAAPRASQIVPRKPGAPDHYRFAHVLVRDALYDRLEPTRRTALHLAVGYALDALPCADEDAALTELAHHFSRAAGIGGAERAIDCLIQAGSRALAKRAHEQACEHFSDALQLLDQHGNDQHTLCTVLLDLGTAQIALGQRTASRVTLRRAAELALELGESQWLARAALAMAPAFFSVETGVVDDELIALLQQAIEHSTSADASMQAHLHARLAVAKYWADDKSTAALCDRADELLTPDTPLLTRAATSTSRLIATWRHDNLAERKRLLARSLSEVERSGDPDLKLVIRGMAFSIRAESGNMAGARAEVRQLARLAEAGATPQLRWLTLGYRATLAIAEARLSDAEKLGQRYATIGASIDDRNAMLMFGAQLLQVRYEQDRLEELIEPLHDYVARFPALVAWRASLPDVLEAAGLHREAQQELAELEELGLPAPADPLWLACNVSYTRACYELRVVRLAPVLYERLAPYGDCIATVGYTATILGSIHRYLGMLATLMQDFRAAERHFERALDVNWRNELPLMTAWTRLNFAQMLLARDGSPSSRSMRLAGQALRTAQASGLVRLASRLASL